MNSNECDTAAQEILSKLSLTAARTIQVNPDPTPNCGSGTGWGAVPVGCSIQLETTIQVVSGGQTIQGDNTPHLKYGANPPSGADGINCAFPSPGYSLCLLYTSPSPRDS